MQYWLVKQEPESYSWDTFVKDGAANWTGVRNYQARNNLRSMKKGDLLFYYHSGEARQVVGIATVVKEAYPDPTAEEGDWSAVDLAPRKPLNKPVGLDVIKADKSLSEIHLVKNSRLSVSSLTSDAFMRILKLSETSLR